MIFDISTPPHQPFIVAGGGVCSLKVQQMYI